MKRLIFVSFALGVVALAAALQACATAQPASAPPAAVVVEQPVPSAPVVVNSQPQSSEATVPQQPNAAVKPERWPDETFFVRASSGLVAYNMANGQQRFTMPSGLMSADGKAYFAAQPHPYANQPQTVVTAFAPNSGIARDKFTIAGRWDLSGVSYTGRWLALTRAPSDAEKAAWTKAKQWHTDIQVVDTTNGKVAHTLKLDGNFEVETIAPDSYSLFLVEHLPAVNPDHYLIRLYDLYTEKLQPGALRDKLATDEVMAGLAWDGVASPDGHWLLTLYLSTQRNTAFVHTLDLYNKYPVCIDLPSGSGDFSVLKQYTLALSPSGTKLYAANATLGVVAQIDMNSRQVSRTDRFAASSYATPRAANPQTQLARNVMAKDGSRLYFTSGWDVWAYDPISGKVDGPFLSNAPIAGLALSGDGKRLTIATTAGALAVYDTATGAALKFPQVTARVSRSAE